jgi:hypothetical protein
LMNFSDMFDSENFWLRICAAFKWDLF